MDAKTAFNLFINPSLDWLASLGGPPRDKRADILVLATMIQESGLSDRIQGAGDKGPARSYAQFEQIGVTDVMTRARTAPIARKVCQELAINTNSEYVFNVMAWNDTLATCISRLNYWNSRLPLPTTEDEGWQCYNSTWRPGAPSRTRWTTAWRTAMGAV